MKLRVCTNDREILRASLFFLVYYSKDNVSFFARLIAIYDEIDKYPLCLILKYWITLVVLSTCISILNARRENDVAVQSSMFTVHLLSSAREYNHCRLVIVKFIRHVTLKQHSTNKCFTRRYVNVRLSFEYDRSIRLTSLTLEINFERGLY
jgi:hypothetical protein